MTEPGTPAAREYVAALTGLRGIAACAVFLYHYHVFNPGIRLDLAIPVIGSLLQFPLGLGFAGVDLFFVLSGFLLSLPFAATALRNLPAPSLGRYFKRRILRVFPAYYAQLAIIVLVGAWFVTWRPLDGTEWLAHALMFFNIGPHPVRPLVGVWWTLPVEFSFYLLLPLLAWFMRRSRWLWLLAGGLVTSLIFRAWAGTAFDSSNEMMLAASQLPGSLPEFLLGATAAWWYQERRLAEAPTPSPLTLDGLLVAGLMVAGGWLWWVVLRHGEAYWQGHWSMVVSPLVLGAALSAVVLAVYSGSRLGQVLFANRPVHFLGLVSYSLYLWHFIVLQQLEAMPTGFYAEMSGFWKFLVTALLVTGVSTISWLLFERPFYRLGKPRPARD